MIYAFGAYDYTVSLDSLEIKNEAKNSQKRGRTDETVNGLWQAQAKCLAVNERGTLESIARFRTFTRELTQHIETSLYRRYWIFAYFIIFCGCGALGSLHKLESSFDELYQKKAALQKEAVLRTLANPLESLPLSEALCKVSPTLHTEQWFKMGMELLFSHAMALYGRPELGQMLLNLFTLSSDHRLFLPLIDSEGYEQLIEHLIEIPNAKTTLEALRKREQVEKAATLQALYEALQTVDSPHKSHAWYKRAISKLSMLTLEIASDTNSKLLPKCLALIAEELKNQEFLEPFCEKNSRLRRLKGLYGNLLCLSPKTQMQKRECLLQAYFIECSLPHLSGTQFKKSQECPRSILRSDETGDVFIQLKSKSTLLKEIASVKKVTAAIHVPPHAECNLAAQATTRDEVPENQLKEIKKEHKITKELQGYLGIWPTLGAIEHKKKKGDKTISKISQFSPLADGDLAKLADSLTFDEFYLVTTHLLSGLRTMHHNSFVHADIKGSNALIKKLDDGYIKSGWIDFGNTFKPATETPPKCFDGGIYGTYNYTPPEVFGVRGFHGNFFQTDIWAFGLFLYRRYLKRDPSWGKLLDEHLKTPASYETKAKMKQLVIEEIEGQLKTLLQIPNPTKQERFTILIHKMMMEKPASRPEAKEVLRQME